MRSRMRPRLSLANVTSALALFVALGGTSYAVATIDGHDVQKRSLPGDRLVRDGVTGKEVRESSLGTVPNAAKVGGIAASRTATPGKLLPLDATGKFPAAVLPLPDTAGEHTKIAFLADDRTAPQTIFENADFKLTAGCDSTNGPNLTLTPKADHAGWSRGGAQLDNTTSVTYDQVPNTVKDTPKSLQTKPLPAEAGTLVYTSADGARVTVVHYQVNFDNYAGHDCAVTGIATAL